MLRIGVPTGRGGLDDAVENRLGGAPTLTIVDVDPSTGEVAGVKVIENPGSRLEPGRGVRGVAAARALAENGVQVYVGPILCSSSYQELTRHGVKVVITAAGVTVRDAVARALQVVNGREVRAAQHLEG